MTEDIGIMMESGEMMEKMVSGMIGMGKLNLNLI